MATDIIEPHFIFENDVKVLKCPKESCKNRQFATAYSCRRHITMVHGKDFHCPIDGCSQVFDTQLALSKHKKKHKRSFVCDRCNSSFVEEKYLKIYKLIFHENSQITKNFCLQCEEQFDNYGELQFHINEKHNKKTKGRVQGSDTMPSDIFLTFP